MNIIVDREAAAWYKEELGLKTGDSVRFFVRYGGSSPVQSGFSLGIAPDELVDTNIKTEVDGITFFIDEQDEWYFDYHDLKIEFNHQYQEPVFNYLKH